MQKSDLLGLMAKTGYLKDEARSGNQSHSIWILTLMLSGFIEAWCKLKIEGLSDDI